MVTIRDCQPDEADAVVLLWRQADLNPSVTDTADDLRRAIAGGAVVLVTEASGRIVGSVIGGFDGWRANLYRLAVHPSHRRRGVARSLVAEAERRLASRGARRFTALVEADRAGAVAFWEAAGYARDQRMARFVRNR